MRQLASAIAAICLVAPRLAVACPVCAARSDGGYGQLALIGSMIVLPFTIAYVTARVIRKANED